MHDQPHARSTDPLSSHETVGRLDAGRSMRDQIMAIAQQRTYLNMRNLLPSPYWTDSEMAEWLETLTGRRVQRSVVARTRGLLERETPTHIARGDTFRVVNGRKYLQFRHMRPDEIAAQAPQKEQTDG